MRGSHLLAVSERTPKPSVATGELLMNHKARDSP